VPYQVSKSSFLFIVNISILKIKIYQCAIVSIIEVINILCFGLRWWIKGGIFFRDNRCLVIRLLLRGFICHVKAVLSFVREMVVVEGNRVGNCSSSLI